jgi:protein ImuB
MSLADATARWGGRLRLEKDDPAGDREALVAVARRLDRFSPLVGLEDAPAPESLLLDISGVAVLLGGESALAEAAIRTVAAEPLICWAGVADAVGAAWAAAHHGDPKTQPVVIPSGRSAAFLAPLSVKALRLSAATLELLAEFGLQTIGDVMGLPRASLSSRLGTELPRRLSQALGDAPETFAPVEAERRFVAGWDFESPTDRGDVVAAVLEPLCRSLAARLSHQGYGALELVCVLRCEPQSKTVLSAGLFEPLADASHFFELLRLQLERCAPPGPVVGLHLEAPRTAPTSQRQRELFAEGARADGWEFSLLVNRLAGRLGPAQVVRPIPRADAQPELAWREESLLDRGTKAPASRKRRRRPDLLFGPLERPLFLFRPPRPIQVTAVVPDGPPARFDCDGQTHRIARHFGPERIETGWWRKRGVRRDYYRVETEAGGRFWLFRGLGDGRWYLHGEFA